MGNFMWCCCKGEEDDGDIYGGADHYAYYYPASSIPASPTSTSSLLRFQAPTAPTSRPQPQLLHAPPPPVFHGVASSTQRSSHLWSEPPSVQAPGHQQQLPPRPHGVASSTQRSSLLQPQPPPAPVFRPQQQQPQPPPVTHGVACATPSVPASRAQRGLLRFEHDLLNFFFTKRVPEGLEEHVTSSKKAQVEWYRNSWRLGPHS